MPDPISHTRPCRTDRVRAPVDHDVGRELVPADMADEVDAHAARPRVVHVPVQAQRPEVAFELAFEQGSRLPAARVAGALGAHEDEVFVRAGARLERGGGGGLWGLWRGSVEGRGCCGGWGDVVVYELGDCGGGDVVDEGEGGEEEDGCGAVGGWRGLVGVGGREG